LFAGAGHGLGDRVTVHVGQLREPPPLDVESARGSSPEILSVPAARLDSPARPWISSFWSGGSHVGAGTNKGALTGR
jgi:hypothetical protein